MAHFTIEKHTGIWWNARYFYAGEEDALVLAEYPERHLKRKAEMGTVKMNEPAPPVYIAAKEGRWWYVLDEEDNRVGKGHASEEAAQEALGAL